ncbi:GPI ethanolamine phosphate transferase 1-like [Anneissia japonica]|uniref:GPI ethanolamine phosphate transferase 1-like n=1 Tax=Anneissia japonica TaxID=1529436 RepID=UPI0014256213|nr:GPI ethanolamine phosphate transferase 1-like [Anneissia japonica]XP_033116797.1 GPI ethanolamine phosphate transferase 1-like [Anneissia japonica]
MDSWFVVVGFLVHVVFFMSIFDIYFTSPLVHGMTPISTEIPPPADRLVLIVADGLRADKLFQLDSDGQTRAPFIRKKITLEGSWGVSHTRVPTESRPGHVALIAGFYEDVSAVAKGWKENPVDFDSVFNQSSYTWSWGSPDILPMFAKGATGEHVTTNMYPAESEDFAGSDASRLDTWVFDQVKEFLDSSKADVNIHQKLSSTEVVLFLHLLGLDTNGHGNKPYSKEYLENIQVVDTGVEHLEKQVEEYFGHDGRTAYILTADHGMTNWGSHGAGHPDETLTPLVAWGAGINKARSGHENIFKDRFNEDWRIQSKRSDVNQADIAPLMTSLIGVAYPMNSVGILPTTYLNMSDKFKAKSLLTNAKQILAQYQVKEKSMRDTTLPLFFKPFHTLSEESQKSKVEQIEMYISQKQYDLSMQKSLKLIHESLDGLSYYQTYNRFFLEASITLGYIGWMLYIFQVLVQNHTNIAVDLRSRSTQKLPSQSLELLFIGLGVIIAVLLYCQHSPAVYYIYVFLPLPLWYRVTKRFYVFQELLHYVKLNNMQMEVLCYVVIGVVAMEVLVLSLFYREVISLGLLGLALWSLSAWNILESKVLLMWVTSCLILAIFPMMPVVGREPNIQLVTLASILCVLIYIISSVIISRHSVVSSNNSKMKTVQFFILCLAIYIVHDTNASIEAKDGLPVVNQILSWVILLLSFLLPLLTSDLIVERLFSIASAFVSVYLLMTTAHEGLFCLVLCFVLFSWLLIELQLCGSATKLSHLKFERRQILDDGPSRHLALSDIRVGYFFIFFLLTAYFGTGNIASINSFDPTSVYCFLTIFNPFVMGILLLWKIALLFVLVTCTFQAIHLVLSVPMSSLFLLVLLMSDSMALHFFYLVQDTGSWLEIGTSISHYVIVMTMILFVLLLMLVSRIFTAPPIDLTRLRRKYKFHGQ